MTLCNWINDVILEKSLSCLGGCVRCRSVAISWVQGRRLSRPWYIGLGQPWRPNPPPMPWPGTQAPAPAQFSCLPIFAKRLASYGLARVWAKARQPNPPDGGPRSHGFQVVDDNQCVECFLFWSILGYCRIVASRQWLQSDQHKLSTRLLRSLDTRSLPPVLGDIIPRSPLHHGSFLGNSGQHGHWRLCLDPANISDIYQTGNFNENKNIGAIGNWNWSQSDFLVLVYFNAIMIQIKTLHS